MTLSSAIITLLFVMDPLGNIPVFLSVLNHVEPKKRKWIILRESFFAFVILTTFLLFGQYLLDVMHISQPALSIAGGIILFLIAIRMIFPQEEDPAKPRRPSDPFIVPLAVPLIAGPSTMTMIMLFANQAPQATSKWFLALLLAWTATTIILIFADSLRKILRTSGLTAIERLMGMVLTTMSVQMLLSGVEQFFHLST